MSSPALRRSDGSAVRVLVVDDEESLAGVLATVFRGEGWQVRTASTGGEAVAVAREHRPDLVVLDRMLPDLDGVDVLERLRDADPGVRVLMLTARGTVPDRLSGLDAGADDYVVKPFELDEVIARLHGLLRRSGRVAVPDGPRLRVSDLELDEEGREVWRGGDPVILTATEFELLRFLMRHARKVVRRAEILEAVWHYDYGGEAHVVEIYVSYLRKKIDAGRDPLIHTVRGVGYVLRPAR